MGYFRKKPVVIEAYQYGSNPPPDWCLLNTSVSFSPEGARIVTLEGTMTAHTGDWIIKGVKGEIYPCKPDIFEATYEPATEPTKEPA